MSIPLWSLLGFAAWTILTLLISVAPYRWSRILTGRAGINAFPADRVEGSDFYRRSMRAHANCVENLPVLTAVIVVALATGVTSSWFAVLSVIYLGARICQTMIHIFLPQTEKVVAIRFTFFLSQLVCIIWMGAVVVVQAL